MKRLIYLWGLLLLLSVPAAAEDVLDEVWNNANHAYTTGDYDRAIEGYDSIHREGYGSAKLYYNLGNAYFKSDQIGKAILNFNKALRLDPADEDLQHNLAVANGFVKDRIEVVPEFFLKTGVRNLMYRASSDTWAILSLIFFAVTLALVALYLLGSRMGQRKLGFYGGIIFLLFSIGTLLFASIERRHIVHPNEAVIMISAAPVKSEPEVGSKDIFVLHEGTKVRITGKIGDWREVMIADGNKGWLDLQAIELID